MTREFANLNSVPVSHRWERITNLPDDWETLARPDLDAMLALWLGEKGSLRDQAKVDRLSEKLATLWAIETGLIERLYTIDRGMTETLMDLGLGAIERFRTTGRLTANVARMIEDQRAALDFVFSYIKETRPLSLSYIKELHQLILRNQVDTEAIDGLGRRFRAPLLRGEWKKLPNNPLTPEQTIHEYCPPEFVQEEMENLLSLHHAHDAHGVRPEVEAAWLHHRFTQIHPFQDGNGRIARALSTMVFLKAGFLPLVVRDKEHRGAYISALERGDAGDLSPLVNLFANIQTKDLEDAMTFVREIRGQGIRELATSAANASKRRMQQDEEAIGDVAAHLKDLVRARLEEVAFELKQAFSDAGVTLDCSVRTEDNTNAGWWSRQIISAAQTYRYFADFGRFRHWVQLRLTVVDVDIPRWSIIVSLHHKQSRAGLMAAVMLLTATDAEFGDDRPVMLGSDREFTFGAGSKVSDEAFRTWLGDGLKRLLEDWQSRV
ncbi:MAG: Fic family protein [Chloroflexi bacterium]|nr:Fic family protein [Chloroflexota bacterium]